MAFYKKHLFSFALQETHAFFKHHFYMQGQAGISKKLSKY